MRVKDQMGNWVEFNYPPKRIISLVPSQSELLWDLGLENELVGITKFCIHPEEMFRSKTRIGGTKKIDIKKIEALQPDLIIGNKEENEREQIEALMKKFPVWMSDIYTMSDALQMIKQAGKITARKNEADHFSKEIKKKLADFKKTLKSHPRQKSVAYFIWKAPYMVAGRETFIDHLLSLCELENVFSGKKLMKENFANKNLRYPEITIQQLKKASPEIILLSSEPFPFKEKHVNEFREICPHAKIIIVDGEMFSWYGTRMLKAFDYLKSLPIF